MRKLGKIITTIVVLGAIGGGYYYYKTTHPAATTAKKYIVGAAAIGTVVSTVEGSGQVAAVDETIVKPKVSGDATSVKVKLGQAVKAGTVLMTIDNTDALKSVRDAEASYASAKLSYERSTAMPTSLDILKADNSLINAQESRDDAAKKVSESVTNGYDAVSSAFLDLPTVMTGMQDMLRGVDVLNDKSQWNIDYYTDLTRKYDESVDVFRTDVDAKYDATKKAYDANLILYKATDRGTSQTEVTNLIYKTYETSLLVDKLVKSVDNLIQFQKDTLSARNLKPAPFTEKHLTALDTYGRTVTSTINSVNSAKTTIDNAVESLATSERSLRELTATVAETKAGPAALDIQSAKLALASAANKLADVKATLKDYTVTAPMGGIIIKVGVEKGNSVSSGTEAFTINTVNKVATVSLAEVDASIVKIGQSAVLTFDAAADLEMTGKVVEMDAVGTVTQGVVTYKVKISMDTQDDRIKPSMSVTAVIATANRLDVVTVPNGAIKKANGQSYVEMAPDGSADGATVTAEPTSLKKANVTTGLIGSETTEITKGLKEGDLIIVRAATATTTTPANNATRSIFGGGGRIGG
jgi:RND family efflux transporter MFP subunit